MYLFSNKTNFLKKSLAIAFGSLLAIPALAALSIQNGKLVDANGNPVVLRGVTIDHAAAPEKTIQALKDISALGANSAQIEFSIKHDGIFPRPIVTQIAEIVRTCVEQKLICVLEANDIAGFGSVEGAASPSGTIDYWREFHSLIGMQDYIIIGLGNQHFGSSASATELYLNGVPSYLSSLMSMLPIGFVVMVDGNGWGQDGDRAMHQVARNINLDENFKKRVIYSVDFYDQYPTAAAVNDYMAAFSEIGSPLIVGGFGAGTYRHPFNIGPFPDVALRLPAEAVMQYAEQYGFGYFGWSWDGISSGNPASLTTWGNILFNDVNGIKATAKRASIFEGSSSSQSSSSTPANRPPIADFFASNYPTAFCGSPNVGAGKISATAAGSIDPDGDALTYAWQANSGSATGYEVTFPSQRWQTYQLTLTVTDSKGASTSITKSVGPFYIDCFGSSSSIRSSSSIQSSSSVEKSSSSIRSSSSSVVRSSSSVRSISSSSARSISSSSVRSSSSSSPTKAQCSYQLNSQWGNGFTASIRIKNTSTSAINGWAVNWQYTDGSKITGLWNATLSGNNPYSAQNLNWNANIQPGQTVEFGFQGSKPAAAASVPVVNGAICQ